ncbi:MAG: protein kinase [Candidatus Methylacidiphilales bacterium]
MFEARTFEDLVPNAMLGHYTLVEHIADGGMGRVFRAFEPSLQRDVAIKILKSEFATDTEVLGRFEMEAQNIAALRHPNIVPVYYVGHQGELYFFVMPFITGQTLDVWLDAGSRVTLDEAKWILYQAVDALDRAYIQNIIHLDIKPSNFLVDENGTILLTDFGLARVLGTHTDPEDEDCFGTPAYMCPEQILRKDTDQRSDIYSLGATMFHLITGQFLFTSDSITELVRAHLKEPFPIARAELLGLPPGWIHLLERMTRKDPDERYQNYADLRKALDNVERLAPIRPLTDDTDLIADAGPVTVPVQSPSPDNLHGLLGDRFKSWMESGIEDGIERERKEIFDKITPQDSLKVDQMVSSLREIAEPAQVEMTDLASALSMVPEIDQFITQLGASELFAGQQAVQTRRQAIRLVGLDFSSRILLAGVMLQQFSKKEAEFTWRPYWEYAVATGVVAHVLLKLLEGEYLPGKGMVEMAKRATITSVFKMNSLTRAEQHLFAACLVHGIGKLIMAELAPYPYFAALYHALIGPHFLSEEEKKIFKCDHHEVGQTWLAKKRFDSSIRTAALNYNHLHIYEGVVPGLVAVASHVVRIYGIGFAGDPLMRVRDLWKTEVWKQLSSQCKTLILTGDYMDREFIPLVGSLPHFRYLTEE